MIRRVRLQVLFPPWVLCRGKNPGWRTNGQGQDFTMRKKLLVGPFPQDVGSEAWLVTC